MTKGERSQCFVSRISQIFGGSQIGRFKLKHLVSKRDERQWESFRLARTRGTMLCKLVINCFACPEQKRAKGERRRGREGSGRPNPVVLFVLALFNEQKNVTVALTLGRRCYATGFVHKTQKIPSLFLSLSFLSRISFANFRIKFKLIQLRIISRLIFLVT